MPEAAKTIAVDLVIDHVLHEVRRAVKRPIYRVAKGGIAPLHATAIGWGWLTPTPAKEMLAITEIGRQALRDRARQLEAA